MDVSNASTKNTESTLNSFDFKTPPYVWCFFLFFLTINVQNYFQLISSYKIPMQKEKTLTQILV